MHELPESRLGSLYKDFRPLKDLNPDGYEANITTWRQYLAELYSGFICFQCGTMLLRHLTRKDAFGVPKSIDVVIDSMVHEEILFPLDLFYEGKMTMTDTTPTVLKWFGFNWKPTKGFKSRQKNSKGNDNDYLKDVTLIIKPELESAFHKIYDNIKVAILDDATSITDLVYTSHEFFEKIKINDIIIHDDEHADEIRKIILFYLSRYKHIINHDEINDIIKIIAPAASHILKSFTIEITENDRQILNVKSGIYNLERQIKKLENDLEVYSLKTAKENWDAFRKLPIASQREHIKAKKLSERYLDQLLKYRNNLLTIKNQLDLSSTNAILFDTLSNSHELLKSMNNYMGSAEKIDELLQNIEEQTEQTDEINKLLTNEETLTPGLADEIEKELQTMEEQLSQERGEEATKEHVNEEIKENAETELLLDKLKDLQIDDKNQLNEGEEKVHQDERNLEQESKELVPN
ncbi:phosphatidic acid-binding protein CHM7 NDAI_0G05870 [Naumovozyma dairenensis CBS 421]|uniref:Uncharacterized protein n=1 Tax=Naumovozyma dairenensis (strain ATCC 10597 / BCRC 20456 / CBS 421 / NBRC 0211 / NRRL Y-12639) TaxID=1071378 RepID=J7SBU3_NAUDC|nr:hypothetical protein NDAI_0G05870 [Naumovozyma dairenensis CBS 421]CCK73570.1 hypothetical protein NDAI_0G05870 [Naumovozyma dairenensis CBS 421]